MLGDIRTLREGKTEKIRICGKLIHEISIEDLRLFVNYLEL